MARFEGWVQKINDVADHSYVKSIDNGQFFDCWADNHSGPEQRRICSGYGNYSLANCYRVPVFQFPDTAGIGMYAVDGVCHQSANCFLFSAGVTLNFNVRGYWFSLFTYGTYGRQFWRWLGWPYGSCYWNRSVVQSAEGTDMAYERDVEPGSLPDKIRGMHTEAHGRPQPPDPHELLMDEVALVTKELRPDVEPGRFRGLQRAYLKQVDSLVARGFTGEELAKRINDLAVETQKKVARTIGEEDYEKLMGVKATEQLELTEPGPSSAAGHPVPAEAQRFEEPEPPSE